MARTGRPRPGRPLLALGRGEFWAKCGSTPLPPTDTKMTPRATVVICTRDHPQLLDRCVDSVSRLSHSSYDVLVVDNAPSDDRAREVASRWNARYIVEAVPGLSRARNRGVRECCSVVVAFVDDDARPEPDWLGALEYEFDDPAVMAAAGLTLPLAPSTAVQGIPVHPGTNERRGSQRLIVDRQYPRWFEIANFGGIGDGNNMAFRRSVFDSWPGFDCRLGRGSLMDGSEEHHAFFSLLARGHKVVYTPLAVVRHPSPQRAEQILEFHRRVLVGGTAYFAFLWINFPRYRVHLLRFAGRRVWQAVRDLAGHSPDQTSRASHRLKIEAVGPGVLMYLRAKRSKLGGSRDPESLSVLRPRLPL